ncbi:L-fuconolactonase [Microbacterium halimionae]|uniref:L-fuconolactonase n=1 Tax=Microbacterium halimionae TaxID=1526413 RepID=A0A7W3JQI6_9MICO|nr:amidohydrolase family protein [Microbacterium halimionae]MBA8817162.1 L-fuconolactonase [Microbacterium halimionae]NII94612.1 L-fuconolactonase [Microbacterium halimionae]
MNSTNLYPPRRPGVECPPGSDRYPFEAVDAHVHLWNRARSDYSWIPRDGVLDRDFLPEEAAHELRTAGFGSAVLVQADDTSEDTDYLLEVANHEPWAAAVVGWLPLDSPEDTLRSIKDYANESALIGVRHLVHIDPRPHFLERSTVRQSAALLAEAGLTLDVPDAYPDHLNSARALAEAVPDLTVVIDHLGKPPAGHPSMRLWEQQLREISGCPNVVVKYSGLHREGRSHTLRALEDLLVLALETFGAQRIMYGGDWPMTTTGGGYSAMWHTIEGVFNRVLSASELSAILGANAQRVYRLNTARASRS